MPRFHRDAHVGVHQIAAAPQPVDHLPNRRRVEARVLICDDDDDDDDDDDEEEEAEEEDEDEDEDDDADAADDDDDDKC